MWWKQPSTRVCAFHVHNACALHGACCVWLQVPPTWMLDRFVDRDELVGGRCSGEGLGDKDDDDSDDDDGRRGGGGGSGGGAGAAGAQRHKGGGGCGG